MSELLRVIPEEIDPTFIDRFVATYQDVFIGAPYYERYTREQVMDKVWTPNTTSGVVVLALEEQQVFGFGCARPVRDAPEDVKDYLTSAGSNELGLDLSSAWYMAELGVLPAYRGAGIGSLLVGRRLMEMKAEGVEAYVLRTAAEGSNSIGIYRRLGARRLEGIQDVGDSDEVVVNGSQSTERVYLYGACDTALATLALEGSL